MRLARRVRRSEEDDESVFISMTDITVSFLFVIMILLAFFATQMAPSNTVPEEIYDQARRNLAARDQQVKSLLQKLEDYTDKGDRLVPWLEAERDRLVAEVSKLQERAAGLEELIKAVRSAIQIQPEADIVQEAKLLRDENNRLHRLLDAPTANPIERYNSRIAEFRGQVLDRLREKITAEDSTIDVTINRNRDALEFKGDGLFPSGSDIPSPAGRRKMEVIAKILKDGLGCVSLGNQSTLAKTCNPDIALIDALQIEGHTDNTGTDELNMGLSSRRGASIYGIMAKVAPELLEFRNLRYQPILSVAGYGKGRPIRDNDTEQARDANRRIDLRFIMFSPTEERFVPQRIEDLADLRERLDSGGSP